MELNNCPEVTAKLQEGLSQEDYVVWLREHLETCQHCQGLLNYIKEEEPKQYDSK